MTFENFIPPRSKSVLEVVGEVAQNFENSKENFLAIQPDCDYKISETLPEDENKFDTIILQSELIGNLENSELVALIKKSAEKLNPRGTLIFTLDNVAFAENILAILKGEPLKVKINLTVKELEISAKEAGANVYRSLHASRGVSVPRKLVEISETDVSVFVHIIAATLEPLPPKTLIHSIIGEKLVCAPIRIHMPNNFIMTEPTFVSSSNAAGENLNLNTDAEYENKILINQRMSLPTFKRGVQFFERLKNAGYLYLSEMDDHPSRWQADYDRTGHINFVGCHAVQTSTKYLAEYLRQFNPNVKVFANQLRKIQQPRNFDEEFRQKNRSVTIFFGALNRDEDFAEILPVINELAKTYGKKISFKIIAHQKLFQSIQTENKILLGDPNNYDGQYITYDKYEEALHTSDIALLPLMDNEFNRSKSDLKFIECASSGAAVLASPVVYSEVVRDGVNGFIFRNLREFEEKFKLLIFNRAKRREVAENAYNYVKHNRLMSQHYEERIDWYRELLARLPELNAEPQKRIDNLAPKFKNEVEPPPKISSPKISENKGLFGPHGEILIPV